VRERIVIEPVDPAPLVRERIVTQPADSYAYDYRYDRYGYRYDDYPRISRRVLPDDAAQGYAYAVGSAVAPTVRTAPVPQRSIADVPVLRSYRYMVVDNRVLLVDPVTSTIVAEVAGY
jgi:hypothetical protein